MSKIYLITGTSAGFGRALAEAVLANGDAAVLTARKPETVAELVGRFPDTALPVRLDVTDPEQREEAVGAALERFGRLDVLVNNAGRGSLGAFEEFSEDQFRQQMEVNFFGTVEMTRAVLPQMKAQGSGHIVNVTSVGGLVSMGGFALYCASKFAVEGFSEGLRDEVRPFGVRVTIVEPGAFRTDFAGEANMRPERHLAEYDAVIEPLRQYLYGNSGKQPGDPAKAALAIIAAVESEQPPLRLLLGADAYAVWEQKRKAEKEEFVAGRTVGEATAFEGAEVLPVGGSQ